MKNLVKSINNNKINTNIKYLPRYYFLAPIVWLTKVSIFEADVKIIEVKFTDWYTWECSLRDIIKILVPISCL